MRKGNREPVQKVKCVTQNGFAVPLHPSRLPAAPVPGGRARVVSEGSGSVDRRGLRAKQEADLALRVDLCVEHLVVKVGGGERI